MSMNIERAASALQEALLSLSSTDPDGNSATFENLLTETQKIKMREYTTKIITAIIDEILNHAKLTITMSNHTHTFGPIAVVGGGGGTVQGVTDAPSGQIEYGDPEASPSTGGIS